MQNGHHIRSSPAASMCESLIWAGPESGQQVTAVENYHANLHSTSMELALKAGVKCMLPHCKFCDCLIGLLNGGQ